MKYLKELLQMINIYSQLKELYIECIKKHSYVCLKSIRVHS